MTVHPRADWQARAPKTPQPALYAVPYVALHHIGGGPGWPTNVPAVLNGIQLNEQSNGYVDIAYCRGVDIFADEWELRGDVKDGATLGYSGQSFSILVIANGAVSNFQIPARVVQAIVNCIRSAQARGVVHSNPTVVIQDHQWFDRHITGSPTWCASDVIRGIVPEVQVAVQLDNPVVVPPTAAPTSPGEIMQFFDKENASDPNRTRSVSVMPDGKIFRNNGGRLGPHSYTDPTIKPFGAIKYYDLPSTFAPDESFVGANYHPDGSNSILYQTRLGMTGTLADHKLVFTTDGA